MTNVTVYIDKKKSKLIRYIALEKETTVSDLMREELKVLCKETIDIIEEV